MELGMISFAILEFCISLSLLQIKIHPLRLIIDNFMLSIIDLLNQVDLNPGYRQLSRPLLIQMGLIQIITLLNPLIQ